MTIPDLQQNPPKVCQMEYELEFNIDNFKNWLFLTVVFYKSVLRISSEEKHMKIIRNQHNIFPIFY